MDSVIRIPIQLEPYDHLRNPDLLVLQKMVTWDDVVTSYPVHWKGPRQGTITINKDKNLEMSVISGVNVSTGNLEFLIDRGFDGAFDNDSLLIVDSENRDVMVWYEDDQGRSVKGAVPGTMPLKLSSSGKTNLSYNMPVIAMGDFTWRDRDYEVQVMSSHTVNTAFGNNSFMVRDKASNVYGSLMKDVLKIGDDFFYVENVDTGQGFMELRLDSTRHIPVKAQVGFRAPVFTESTMYPEKQEINISNYRGRYVLINFWATWCAPCLVHMDEMKILKARFGDDVLTLISVNIGENEKLDHVVEVIRRREYSWVHLVSREISQQYNAINLPTSFLIDPDGIIVSMDESVAELTERLYRVSSPDN